jgi:hypothetical protein
VDAAASARKVIAGRIPIRERFTARKTNGALAYGKTVWSRHPLLVPSCRWRNRSNRTISHQAGSDGDKTNSLAGESTA